MGPGYWLLRQMILSRAEKARQTKLGLQPFQSRCPGRQRRAHQPIDACPASFLALGIGAEGSALPSAPLPHIPDLPSVVGKLF